MPRHALRGLPFGNLRSQRRGPGNEVIGSRAYRPGDPISTIDWGATARLSAAKGRDEFVVRERAAEDAPRVAIVLDRRPAMSLYPAGLPWLSKLAAMREALRGIVISAVAARADLAELDFAGGEAHWLPPAHDRGIDVYERRVADASTAPEDTLERSLSFLAGRRTVLPGGSFVFMLSDFLAPPAPGSWLTATAHGWDIVPVVIQDPVWERSFPDVHGAALAIADPATGAVGSVRLSRREARARRDQALARNRDLAARFASFGLHPVQVATSDPHAIDQAFLAWAEERRRAW